MENLYYAVQRDYYYSLLFISSSGVLVRFSLEFLFFSDGWMEGKKSKKKDQITGSLWNEEKSITVYSYYNPCSLLMQYDSLSLDG